MDLDRHEFDTVRVLAFPGASFLVQTGTRTSLIQTAAKLAMPVSWFPHSPQMAMGAASTARRRGRRCRFWWVRHACAIPMRTAIFSHLCARQAADTWPCAANASVDIVLFPDGHGADVTITLGPGSSPLDCQLRRPVGSNATALPQPEAAGLARGAFVANGVFAGTLVNAQGCAQQVIVALAAPATQQLAYFVNWGTCLASKGSGSGRSCNAV